MRKIKISVHYPWCGTPDDKEVLEIDDNFTELEIEELVNEVSKDMIFDKVSVGWEEVKF